MFVRSVIFIDAQNVDQPNGTKCNAFAGAAKVCLEMPPKAMKRTYKIPQRYEASSIFHGSNVEQFETVVRKISKM